MQKVYILTGLIGSGKSTWAKRKVQEDDNAIIINRDSIRTMIKDKYIYHKKYEEFIKEIAREILFTAIGYGFNVIIDETNLTKEKRAFWIQEVGCYIDVQTILVYCTESERNLEYRMREPRGQDYKKWKTVLEGMKKSFEEPELSELPNGSVIELVNIPEQPKEKE